MTRTRVYRDGRLEREDFPAAEVSDYLGQPDTVVWLDVCSADDGALHLVAEELGLDPLAVEDAVHRRQRAKVDQYAGHLFVTVYTTRLDEPTGALQAHELSLFVTAQALVTVRDRDVDPDRLAQRWDAGGPVHRVGTLLHGLLDVVVDGHFEVVQHLDEEVEAIEDLLFAERPDREAQRRTYALRKNLVQLRRVVLPMREVLNTLLRRDLDVVDASLRAGYQDVYDHVLRAAEWTEGLRDMVTTLFETHLAMQDHRLNTVMKQLTAWAAIIAVPTAVTGYFGQNVPFPGDGRPAGFWLSLALIAGGVTALWLVFRRKGWI